MNVSAPGQTLEGVRNCRLWRESEIWLLGRPSLMASRTGPFAMVRGPAAVPADLAGHSLSCSLFLLIPVRRMGWIVGQSANAVTGRGNASGRQCLLGGIQTVFSVLFPHGLSCTEALWENVSIYTWTAHQKFDFSRQKISSTTRGPIRKSPRAAENHKNQMKPQRGRV